MFARGLHRESLNVKLSSLPFVYFKTTERGCVSWRLIDPDKVFGLGQATVMDCNTLHMDPASNRIKRFTFNNNNKLLVVGRKKLMQSAIVSGCA